jgi:Big-like domain-containing protein
VSKRFFRSSASLLSLSVLTCSLAFATDYYASPNGNGNGSINNPWSLSTALASSAHGGDTIWLRGGTYSGSYTSYLTGSTTSPVIVRQYPGERAIIDGRSSQDAALTINGSYAWYWGFEVMNSDPTRILPTPGSVGRAFGVNLYGPHTKAINLIVHDTGEGFSFWTPASDSELYGNIIYYNGWEGPDRGHGHGIYVQNQTGTKLMADNIVFDQFSFGLHAYAEGGFINNLTMDGNISFNNGSASSSGYTNNIYLQATNVAQNPVVNNNVTYYTPSVGTGYNTVGNCSNANVNNNYFVSGYFAISMPSCTPVTMTGNTFVGTVPGWITSSYSGNTFSGGGLKVIVRPNRYELGRANIAIFNWNHTPSVSVDISSAGLAVGQAYELRDAQNFLAGPVVTGFYSGAPISVPMTGLSMALPIGTMPAIPPHTSAEFGAYVLLPSGQLPSGSDNVPPTVAITAPSAGASVSGSLTITASASDNVGIGGVQFQVDGTDIGGEVVASPYSATLDTTNLSNTNHTITAIARDTSNNRTPSAPVTVSVSNVNGPGPFVTAYNLNNSRIRNDYTGWVGMQFTVASDPISIASLGRVCLSGNSGTHTVKLVRASDGADVPGGSAVVAMAGCVAGQFAYTALSNPVTLQAGAKYYLVTQETSGGDQWYDLAPLTASNLATITNSIYSSGASWLSNGGPSTSYAPPNFRYATATGDSTAPTVSISSPSNGAFVSGSLNITAGASDNVAVAVVQFKIDGNNIGAEQTVSPYAVNLDTTTIATGQHQLTAVARDAAGNSATSSIVTINVSNVSAASTPFLTSFNANARLRNDFGGWVGMKFTVGPAPLNVSSLGRIFVSGNSGTHIVKLVRASDGGDVAGGSVSISMSGGVAGQFKYAPLGAVLSLSPNTSYYLVSQEVSGGDQWYDYGTVSSTADAAINSAVYSSGSNWLVNGPANSSYVPANFLYLTGGGTPPPPTVAFVTGVNTTATLRNNFTGWVGTKFTVGASGLTVYSLGRIVVSGNSGSHLVKLVRASDGTDVPGASITVALAGAGPGQFTYATLPAPVALAANTNYYLVSYETAGGDTWYDITTVSTTAAAAITNSVYFDGTTWIPMRSANTSYVPPNFQYTGGVASADTSFVKTYNLNNRPLRNDFSGWAGMKLTVGSNDVTISALGRIFIAGNSGTHSVELVRVSDGATVPGGSVSLSMAGGTVGQFSYAPLANPITLQANTSYYLVSQEFAGGDQWYDYGTLSTSASAAVNSAVYSYDGVNWYTVSGSNTSYVPPNFK